MRLNRITGRIEVRRASDSVTVGQISEVNWSFRKVRAVDFLSVLMAFEHYPM